MQLDIGSRTEERFEAVLDRIAGNHPHRNNM